MNGTGNRKLKAYFVTVAAVLIVIETGLFLKVAITGDNIVLLTTILAGISTAFFGANFGEHWANTKASDKE